MRRNWLDPVRRFSVCGLLAALAAPMASAQSSAQPDAAAKKLNTAPTEAPAPITIQYVATLSGSTVSRLHPAIGHRLLTTDNLTSGHSLSLRVEQFNNGSYNADPPGVTIHNVNEPQFETQGYYTVPIHGQWTTTASVLHHDNFRFPDSYWWAISTLTYATPPVKPLAFSANASIEKRLAGGRLFGDFLGTTSYAFNKRLGVAATLHQYESLASEDSAPTENQDYEIGLVRQLPEHRFAALTFFRHIKYHDVNDQFSYVRIKYGISLK